MASPGTLFVVATPIGNLRDVTLRALDVLGGVAHVVAEDTRHTRKLLAAHGVRARLSSLHAHSGDRRLDWVVERLLEGEDVACVTDAGAPGVSDPGVELVDRARRAGAPVQVVPGASAVTSALAVAGLPCGRFLFLGFLPRSTARRRSALAEAGATGAALVLFESPRRARELLEDLAATMPDREVALCRELTKLHEEVLRGRPADLTAGLDAEPRGEVTVVVAEGAAARSAPPDPGDLAEAARELVASGIPTREAADRLAETAGLPRREAYRAILAARGDADEAQ